MFIKLHGQRVLTLPKTQSLLLCLTKLIRGNNKVGNIVWHFLLTLHPPPDAIIIITIIITVVLIIVLLNTLWFGAIDLNGMFLFRRAKSCIPWTKLVTICQSPSWRPSADALLTSSWSVSLMPSLLNFNLLRSANLLELVPKSLASILGRLEKKPSISLSILLIKAFYNNFNLQ